ncbi:MAG: Holliday junction branch migration protein RuvA [Microbacteriaceae bacterium]
MISSVRGIVLSAVGTNAVVEVGGIGLSVQVTPAHGLTLRTGAEAFLRTAFIVREDEMSLYGFESSDELMVFDALRSVTGVGPRSAMGVLAVMTPGEVAHAITLEDDAAFRKVSGIGPKTAKLIIVSLAGKLLIAPSPVSRDPRQPQGITENVVLALVGLGWQEKVALQAVDDAIAGASDADASSVQSLLRLSLAHLGPQQPAGSTP